MKKTILFFIESLDVGGAEKSLVSLLNNADFSNYNVDLMMLKKGAFSHEVPGYVKIIFLNKLQPSLLQRLRFNLLKVINLKKLHPAQYFWKVYGKNFKMEPKTYDVAIAYSQGFSTYFVAEKVSATRKYTWLNTDYQKMGYQISSDYPFYKCFNKIIAVSHSVLESFNVALQNINRSLPVDIIKDITDKKTLEVQANQPLKTKFPADRVNIVSVGRLVPPKGFSLAVSACAILKSKGYSINWYIIGEGAARNNLEQQIAKENLKDQFFLLGADANPYPYMKACDIYVQTSLFEGLGLTVIEASCLNKPIVCTNFPTVYGILVDDQTGLISEMTAESVAAQIERLINHPDLRQFLSSNLLNQENTDKEISLEKIEKLLSE